VVKERKKRKNGSSPIELLQQLSMERIRRLEMQLIILRRLETRTRNLIYARPKRFRPYLFFWGGEVQKSQSQRSE
jgi:hypothetical protein